jgi:hypothetical protein
MAIGLIGGGLFGCLDLLVGIVVFYYYCFIL